MGQANLGPLQTIHWTVNFPNNDLPAARLTHVRTLAPSGYPDYAVKTGAQLGLTAGTYHRAPEHDHHPVLAHAGRVSP